MSDQRHGRGSGPKGPPPGATRAMRRRVILEAAEQVVLAKGVMHTSARKVAAAASEIARRDWGELGYELTTGMIYSQFGSMTDLLIALLESRQDDLLATLTTAADGGSGLGLADLGRRVNSHLSARESRLVFEAIVGALHHEPFGAEFRDRLHRHRDQLRRIVEREQAGGRLADGVSVAALVRFCRCISTGATVLSLIDPEDVDPAEWNDLIDRVCQGLSTADAPRSMESIAG